jgi:N-acylneuraminate cytidylyltransferase/CMP-N,N'-diacetyllegionaminic acid synthase
MTAILCTVCARGGSSGVPGKNLHELGGTPLIGRAVQDALEWGREADVVVSSDDPAIREAGERYGAVAPFERPASLAADDAAKLPVIRHALRAMEEHREMTYDYVVDIDATVPLRQAVDIERCFQTVHEDPETTNAYTVCPARKNPYFNMVEVDDEGYARLVAEPADPVVRRQDAPTVYEMNAAVYVFEREFLMATDTVHGPRTRVSVMPPERSVDIDTPWDLQLVEFLYSRQEGKTDG